MPGKAYSLDLRERVMADCAAGLSAEVVAEKYRVSAWWVYKLKRRQRETGSIAPLQHGGYKRQALAGEMERLKQFVKDHPDATLEEIRQALGLKVHLSVLWGALDRLKLTVKKNPVRQRAKARRRSGGAQGMARRPSDAGCKAASVHRRDLGFHQHDASLWPRPERRAACGVCPAQPLENHHLRRRPAA